jgi:HK97 family phage prohead protease
MVVDDEKEQAKMTDQVHEKRLAGRPEANGPADDRPLNTVLTPEQAARVKGSIRRAKPGRTFRFHMKLVETDRSRRRIEGYASTRDLDRTGDVIQPGAFADSLKDFMSNPVLTYMHDWSDPIGKVIDARIDEVGLYIRAKVSETAERVWKLIEEGILRAFSIGYEVLEERPIDGVNQILKLRLYEVAIVSIPANRRALFSVSKALEAGDDLVSRRSDDDSGESPQAALGSRPEAGSAFTEYELKAVSEVLREVMDKLSASVSGSTQL